MIPPRSPRRTLALLISLAAAICACAEEPVEPAPSPLASAADREAPQELSAWGFFEGPMAAQRPAAGVLPYQVAAPLWADHAEKGRFLLLPPGQGAIMGEDEGWVWPLGTIFIKTFFFDLDRRDAQQGEARIVETRLLRVEEEGLKSYIYVWDEAQLEATLKKTGERVQIAHVDEDGQAAEQLYLVPNTEECNNCHEIDDELFALGLTVSQLNRPVEREGQQVNQLQWLADQGAITNLDTSPEQLVALPDPFDPASGDLDSRARAYLHGNCGHCHREGGGGGRSGLRLVWSEDRDRRVGVCKGPVAAGSGSGGRTADIVPGRPDQSIFIFRMGSTDPEIKMPELPNLLPDDAGIALITEWISKMQPEGCP